MDSYALHMKQAIEISKAREEERGIRKFDTRKTCRRLDRQRKATHNLLNKACMNRWLNRDQEIKEVIKKNTKALKGLGTVKSPDHPRHEMNTTQRKKEDISSGKKRITFFFLHN